MEEHAICLLPHVLRQPIHKGRTRNCVRSVSLKLIVSQSILILDFSLNMAPCLDAHLGYGPSTLPLRIEMMSLEAVRTSGHTPKNNTVLTDNVHSYLLHFQNWHPINDRQRCLVTYLIQFQLVLKYVKGVHNFTADALSHLYQDLPEGERVKCIPSQDDFICFGKIQH